MTAVPKPTARPYQFCPACRTRRFRSLRALARHAKSCGQPPKKNKFNAKRTGSFPSKLEHDVYQKLIALKRAGLFAEVERYPTLELVAGIKWKVDFKVTYPNGDVEYHEAKGVAGERYRVVLQLYRELGPAKLVIWKAGRGGEPVIKETVVSRREKQPPAAVREFLPGEVQQLGDEE